MELKVPLYMDVAYHFLKIERGGKEVNLKKIFPYPQNVENFENFEIGSLMMNE